MLKRSLTFIVGLALSITLKPMPITALQSEDQQSGENPSPSSTEPAPGVQNENQSTEGEAESNAEQQPPAPPSGPTTVTIQGPIETIDNGIADAIRQYEADDAKPLSHCHSRAGLRYSDPGQVPTTGIPGPLRPPFDFFYYPANVA